MALYSTICLEQQCSGRDAAIHSAGRGEGDFLFGGVRPPEQQPEMERVDERFHETARFWKKVDRENRSTKGAGGRWSTAPP